MNKGDDRNWNYRSRWVAKQFKTNTDFELFAATPPLDALRYFISTAASMRWLLDEQRREPSVLLRAGHEKHVC